MEVPYTFPQQRHYLTFPSTLYRIPVSPHPHQYLFAVLFVLFDSSHPNGFEVISHCGFYLHSLMINDIEHLPMCLLAICISSLQKLIEMFCPFLNQVVYFLSFRYRQSSWFSFQKGSCRIQYTCVYIHICYI